MRCSCRSLWWPSGVGTGTAAPASQDWRDGSDQFRWESRAPSSRPHGSRSPCWSPVSSSKRVGADRAPIRLCLRYLLTVLVVFAAVNLPFLAWHPGAWWHGTLIPLTGGLVADGQGFVTLATHGLTGGVNLTMLSLAGAAGHGRRRRCVRRMVPAAQADLALAPDDPLLLFAAQPFELPRRPLSSCSRRSTLCRRRAPGRVRGSVRRGETCWRARRCWWSPYRALASSSRRSWPSAGHLCSCRCAASSRPTPARSSMR